MQGCCTDRTRMNFKKIYKTGWFRSLKFLTRWILAGRLLLAAAPVTAQYLPIDITNQGISLFLDELATEQVIDLYSLVKPYGRKEIAGLLIEADSSRFSPA